MKHVTIAIIAVFLCISLHAQQMKELTTQNGLSSSLVNGMFQDSTGDIWISSENGLNRYDGLRVHVYKSDPLSDRSLRHNTQRVLTEDLEGRIIIGTQSGVQIYDRRTDSFSSPLRTEDGQIFDGSINGVILRKNGEVWISGDDLMKIRWKDSETPELTRATDTEFHTLIVGDMVEDGDSNLWMIKHGDSIFRIDSTGNCTSYIPEAIDGQHTALCSGPDQLVYVADNRGSVCHFDTEKGRFVKDDIPDIAGSRVNVMYLRTDGTLLIGTDGNGAYQYNPEDRSVELLRIGGLSNSSSLKIHSFIEDKEGNLWVGIYHKGVIMIPQRTTPFRYIGSKSSDTDYIGSHCVTSLMIDDQERIWVGTDNDGIYVIRRWDGTVDRYTIADGCPSMAFGIIQDSDGKVWFGSYGRGLFRIDPTTRKMQKGSEITGKDIDNYSFYGIAEDGQKRIWLGSLGRGLFCYDMKSTRFSAMDIPDEKMNQWINDVKVVGERYLYVATFNGLYCLDISTPTPVVRLHVFQGESIYSITSDDIAVYCCMADGLGVLDLESRKTQHYTSIDGLADNSVRSARIAADGKVWISTGSGLSVFDKTNGTIRNYYPADGLMINEFSSNSAVADRNGRIYFGGTDGLVYFNPSRIADPESEFTTKIVDIQSADRLIPLGSKNIYRLTPSENSCSISFTTNEYNAPADVRFRYSTDGKKWNILPLGQSSVTLSGLNPGKHTFYVSTLFRGKISEPEVIHIVVDHPWWSSLTAKIVYLLILMGLILATRTMLRHNYEIRNEIERHRQQDTINEEKLRFFINLSHEIRSPLTLISAPLQSLIQTDSDPARHSKYVLMNKNVEQILQIINQMLDMRKIEKGRLELKFYPTDIVRFTADITDLYREQARRKEIELSFITSCPGATKVWIDPDYFNKIISNLLSNALKYTPEGGKIGVSVATTDKNAIITVKDNGIGMTDEEMSMAFTRFYQAGNATSGTGIGLNLAKMLAELHHGSISVGHNPDENGTVFTVNVPLGNSHLSEEELGNEPSNSKPVESFAKALQPGTETGIITKEQAQRSMMRTILIAEDNEDIREYICSELSAKYNVIPAKDGKQAYNKTVSEIPDLIISDVIMPELDGFSLCKKIRKNPNVSHIPVIMLTAKTMDKDKIEGMEVGADAYLTKPFNMEVLRQTISNLITSREKLKISFTESKFKEDSIRPVNIQTPDDRLMERVMKILNDNLSNPDLTVESLAKEVGISRVHLHRKLKELTNQTSRDFIRNLRLQKAAQMLSEKKYSISELSDAVGFTNPAAFTTAFKQMYGTSPSNYMKSMMKQDLETTEQS